jgi:hypothetical protein
MADTILSGDLTVYYSADSNRKQIKWTGAAAGTRTVNEVYSALQDLFDELAQLDDGVPMSAQTPTEYTIGCIDPSDNIPWFIDDETVQHLKGGAIKTNLWKRTTSTNPGIIRLAWTAKTVDPISTDIGKPVVRGTSTGVLLDYEVLTASTGILWVRPTDASATHDFSSTGVTTITGGSGSVTTSVAGTNGEALWANIYSLGTIAANTDLYVYQSGAKQTGVLNYAPATYQWWPTGHFDILIKVKETDALVDGGYVTVYAREYATGFGYYQVGLAAGGRNPIPLATGSDLNNTTGYRQLVGSSGVGTFTVGHAIYVGTNWGTATKKGIITAIAGSPGTTPTITYYLIGTLADFANLDAVKGYNLTTAADSGATCTSAAPANFGPAALGTPPAITFGATTYDLNNGQGVRQYAVTINCNSNTLANVYEWTKYDDRRGSVDTTNNNGINGECYLGIDYRLVYNTLTGAITAGQIVTQVTSGATGTVVSHDTTNKVLMLRNSRGTFDTTNAVQYVNASNQVTMTSGSATAVTPITANAYGTFAGGKFFAATGVRFTNLNGADVQAFQLTDNLGVVQIPPNIISMTVGSLIAGDAVGVFRTTAGAINKAQYTISGTPAANATTFSTNAINADEPQAGYIRVVKGSEEHRYRYSSWTGTAWTLDSRTAIAATASTAYSAGTNRIDLRATAATFVTWGVQVGDMVYNSTITAYATVMSVDSETQLTLKPVFGQGTAWVTTNVISINALVTSYTSANSVYVPIIDKVATTTSISNSLIYGSSIPVLVRVRRAKPNASPILPFESSGSIGSTGLSVSTIRTSDSIAA